VRVEEYFRCYLHPDEYTGIWKVKVLFWFFELSLDWLL
jgi:hypothetical protein